MTTAYLIDPFNRVVRTVELHAEPRSPDDELHEIYALLDCSYIEAVYPREADGDCLVLDEEGKCKPGQAHFMCRLWPHDALAGKALWIGTNGTEFDNPAMTRQYVENNIGWLVPV